MQETSNSIEIAPQDPIGIFSKEIFNTDHPFAEKSASAVIKRGTPVMLGNCHFGHGWQLDAVEIDSSIGPVTGHRASRQTKPIDFKFRSLRAREIETIVLDRYPAEDGVVPFPDEARAIAIALASHATPEDTRNSLVRWGIDLTDEIEDIIAEAVRRPRRWKADRLADLLGVTREERDRLGLTTIGAVDYRKAARGRARRTSDRDRKRANRAAEREANPKPLSQEKREPWRDLEVSRRTYFYWKAKNVADGCTEPVRSISKASSADKTGATNATFAIEVALQGGPRTIKELIELTGIEVRTLRPVLSRLKAKGKICNPKRGTWALPGEGGPKAAAGRSVRTKDIRESRRPERAPIGREPKGLPTAAPGCNSARADVWQIARSLLLLKAGARKRYTVFTSEHTAWKWHPGVYALAPTVSGPSWRNVNVRVRRPRDLNVFATSKVTLCFADAAYAARRLNCFQLH